MVREDADIVLVPYQYVLDPRVRSAAGLSIGGNHVVFDEAHNIDQVAREAASLELHVASLLRLIADISEHRDARPDIYEPLLRLLQALVAWINTLQPATKEDDAIGGQHLRNVLSEWLGLVTESSLQPLVACYKQASELVTQFPAPDVNAISDASLALLGTIVGQLGFIMSYNFTFLADFQVLLRKVDIKEGPELILSFWCLHGRAALHDVVRSAASLSLCSGSLSPLQPLASELGCKFEVRLEAPHVVDPAKQLFFAALPNAPSGHPLNLSFAQLDLLDQQDAIGEAVLQLVRVVPNGVLCFFPSYSIMEKLLGRWRRTGIYAQLAACKALFIEATQVDNEVFQSQLEAFAACARSRGALYFAVARGKVSEGLDFADEKARAVLVLGVPYPPVMDLQIRLKRAYNDSHTRDMGLLSGSDWYKLQAFRAVNQCIGRCLRHAADWGAVLLLDDRYASGDSGARFSSWMRPHLRRWAFPAVLDALGEFVLRLRGSQPRPHIAVAAEEDENLLAGPVVPRRSGNLSGAFRPQSETPLLSAVREAAARAQAIKSARRGSSVNSKLF
jgi:Fanconi anemia group J protein